MKWEQVLQQEWFLLQSRNHGEKNFLENRNRLGLRHFWPKGSNTMVEWERPSPTVLKMGGISYPKQLNITK